MATWRGLVILFFLVLVSFFGHPNAAATSQFSKRLNRSDFPADFVFGAASAAYQIEGAAHRGGRGPSIWDTFTHKHPEKIFDHSNGDVAVDFYDRYKDDIRLLKEIGMDALRFSISWSRILPYGKICKGVNEEGVRFYNNVINELIAHDLKPFVTLFHWDPPQALEDEYGGFLNPNIVDDYRDYVEFCFKEFGDRVKHWITLNEPYAFAVGGYETGAYAPGRCSRNVGNCTEGNSATEPYIVGHHLLLAHAAAVEVYKNKYQGSQQGEIGITLIAHWYLARNHTKAELRVRNRARDFMLGWFLDPITFGDYPKSMRAALGNDLPKFSVLQSKRLKGSLDFVGINYYIGAYASPNGNGTDTDQPFIYPKGIRDLMLYIKKKYKNPVIYITENGMFEQRNTTVSPEEAIQDSSRVQFYKDHLWYLQKAIKEGAKVKGHFAWSLIDDFEWVFGFTAQFGLIYIDLENGLKRYPKLSALWYKKFLDRS